jgi:hypothetical protein
VAIEIRYRHRAGQQIQIGLIDVRGNASACLAAAYESAAAAQNQFLMIHPAVISQSGGGN